MRYRAFAAIAVFGLTGCVIHANESTSKPLPREVAGDINFLWTFEGKTCLQSPEVRQVRVFIQGETIDNGGLFPCNAGGIDGIRLNNFAPRNYNFTIDGVDASNKTIYTTSGTLHVNGTVTQPVNLNRVGGKEKMQIFWSFSKLKQTCAKAQVSKVAIRINNGENVIRACSEIDPATKQAVEGVAVSNIDAGSYQVQVDGLITDSKTNQDQVWYSATVSLPVVASGTNNFNVSLDFVAGIASFVPAFSNATSCQMAGVETVWIRLLDARNKVVGDANGYIYKCADVEKGGVEWSYLFAADAFDSASQTWFANYTVQMEGWDTPYQKHMRLFAGTQVARVFAGQQNTYSVQLARQ